MKKPRKGESGAKSSKSSSGKLYQKWHSRTQGRVQAGGEEESVGSAVSLSRARGRGAVPIKGMKVGKPELRSKQDIAKDRKKAVREKERLQKMHRGKSRKRR